MQEGAHAVGKKNRYSIDNHAKSKSSNKKGHANSKLNKSKSLHNSPSAGDPGKPKRK
jgi:hypothetical protein